LVWQAKSFPQRHAWRNVFAALPATLNFVHDDTLKAEYTNSSLEEEKTMEIFRILTAFDYLLMAILCGVFVLAMVNGNSRL